MKQILAFLLVGLISFGTVALVAALSVIAPTIAAFLVWAIIHVLGGHAGFGVTWVITTALYFLLRLVVGIFKR